ncbi:MAG: DUF5665 domain-containing protein [bacterium]|nr:DUF5665 domain-containing protein [bacterium]
MSHTDEEKEKSIDRLIASLDKAYHNPGKLALRGFLIGLMSGLGATIGVAIVLGIVGLLIRQFGGLPVVGDWLNDLGRILPQR